MVTGFGGIYRGKRVLVTGHTGFKGGWLSLWLRELGATVHGYSLAPHPEPTLFSILPAGTFEGSTLEDLRTPGALTKAIADCQPEIIFHLAAQPIVGISYREPLDTFTTNALGTAMLLEAVRTAKCPAAVLVVTSDKCYRNDNSGRPFRESDPLGGQDVYSMSKAATELVVASWHASFFAVEKSLGPLATARAGNVIGGGDYAEDRIVPDAVRAFGRGQPITLRRPQATRPWQHVLESASGYLALGSRLLAGADRGTLINCNFGPASESERTVRELIDTFLAEWPGAFKLEIAKEQAYGEAARLSLDVSFAKRLLGWQPAWNFEETVAQTARWYRERHEKKAGAAAMLAFTREQIASYTSRAASLGIPWAK
ncbi:MAG: CDP-glucose 4,6-dehydratase [Chthoniobacteraceae bacterium]